MRQTHGGDWAAFELETGREPLDFSASVSPLGVPEGVRRALCAAAAHADRYPDPDCRALRRALSEAEGVPEAWVYCGNGASELLWRCVRAAKPRRALLPVPCFGEYEAALRACGCAVERFTTLPDFRLGAGILNAVTPETDLLILAQPSSPAGVSVKLALLRQLLRRCSETGTQLVLDECFLGFLDEPERLTLRPELPEHPELLLIRAFTKLWGMAGVRLGWALCADGAFLDAMRREGPPWSVSHLAQEAGVAALRERDYAGRVRALLAAERPKLAEGLRRLGLRVVPGEANYLLFKSAVPLDAPLRERGILLRRCGDFAGLDGGWYRAAVRTAEDNARLLAALAEVLS